MSEDRYPSPKALLKAHGLSPKKSWGQNFLSDPNVHGAIVRATGAGEGDHLVELGAGLGHLTVHLASTGARVTAVERDRELVPILESQFEDVPGVEIVAGDAKQVDLAGLQGDGPPLVVVGNLPYHLTSPILFRLLDHRAHVRRVVVMIQKEVADRLLAGPGNKTYGALTVRFGLYASVSRVTDVSPHAFVPPPKVHSTVLRLDLRETPTADPGDPEVFARLVRAAFNQRRKTLQNALKAGRLVDPEALPAVFEEAGVDPKVRAETLSPESFAALSLAVSRRVPSED